MPVSATSFTFPTAAAAVADQLHAAEITLHSIIRLIQLIFWDGTAPGVRQLELDGLSLKAQAGTGGLLASQLAALDAIGLPILHEAAAEGAEHEGGIVFPALVVQRLDPFVMAGAGTVIVFSVA